MAPPLGLSAGSAATAAAKHLCGVAPAAGAGLAVASAQAVGRAFICAIQPQRPLQWKTMLDSRLC